MTKLNMLAVNEQENFYQQVIEYSIEPTILHFNHEILYINESRQSFLGAQKKIL